MQERKEKNKQKNTNKYISKINYIIACNVSSHRGYKSSNESVWVQVQ